MNHTEIEKLKKINSIDELKSLIDEKELQLTLKNLKANGQIRVNIAIKEGFKEVDGIEIQPGWALITSSKNQDIKPSITHMKTGLSLRSFRTNKSAKKAALYVKNKIGADLMNLVSQNAQNKERIYNGMTDNQKDIIRDLLSFN